MKLIAKNKKAKYDYEILKTFEAGIVLLGPEVKGIKNGHISIKESFISFSENIVLLKNSMVTIPSYAKQYVESEKRDKVLLLHKKEINFLKKEVSRKGYTVIPLSIYVSDKGMIKLEIALAKGKKEYEKRETIKKRDIERSLKDY